MNSQLPQDVLHFIGEQLETVPHLEALLLIWGSGGRAWTADEIAARIYVSLPVATSLLQDLARRRLLASDGASPPRYAYESRHDPEGLLMPRVAATYQQNLVQVAKLIHSKGSPAVREFARAFQITKKELP